MKKKFVSSFMSISICLKRLEFNKDNARKKNAEDR